MKPNKQKKLTPILRAATETGFIIFLFYSNLLMGEFTRSNGAQGKSLMFAIGDVFTMTNFVIAIFSALIAHVIFDHLRKKL